MADNTTFTPGAGATIATDDVSGVHFPLSKITLGALNANDGPVSSSNPMPTKDQRAAVWAVGSAVSVGNTYTVIKAANANRLRILIYNNSSQTVYLGGTTGVTTANGAPLLPSQWWIDDVCTDDIYGIVASGTAEVRVSEMTAS